MIDRTVINQIADGLMDLSKRVRSVGLLDGADVFPTETIKFSDVSENKQRSFLGRLGAWEKEYKGNGSYIYIISAKDDVDIEACRAAFITAKDKKGRAYARLNGSASRTLYVGSSLKIKSRINQHLGFHKSPLTYSLQIRYWAVEPVIEGEFQISICRFDEIDQKALQAIEDGLWDSLKPIFGRKGSR